MGSPDNGHLYFGASLPRHRSLRAWESHLGQTLALNRSYFGPANRQDLVRQVRWDLRADRLPHVSIKPPGTWSEVASGRRDHWLGTLLEELASSAAPVFLSINHEPENESGPVGMRPWNFVAMQRRAIRMAAEVSPNVTVVPLLQQWTFDPVRSDIQPEAWVVPEAAVFGLDVYNPWSPANGKPWRSLGSKVDEALPFIGEKPIAIGEYGCRTDPTHPTRTTQWLKDAVDYARTHNVVSMSYFNSSLNTLDGTFELGRAAESTFARLLSARWVARPR